MAKVIIEKVNTNSIEVLGKTYDSATYSGDVGSREKIKGQTFITLEDVDDSMTVRGEGKDTIIRKVEKADKVEIGIRLLNAENLADGSSLATAILRNVWVAKGKENNLKEIYVMKGTNCQALVDILNIARNMACTPTGARALGKWYPAENGERVIIRLVAEINNKGFIKYDAPSSPCCPCCDCGDGYDDGDDCDDCDDCDEEGQFEGQC